MLLYGLFYFCVSRYFFITCYKLFCKKNQPIIAIYGNATTIQLRREKDNLVINEITRIFEFYKNKAEQLDQLTIYFWDKGELKRDDSWHTKLPSVETDGIHTVLKTYEFTEGSAETEFVITHNQFNGAIVWH